MEIALGMRSRSSSEASRRFASERGRHVNALAVKSLGDAVVLVFIQVEANCSWHSVPRFSLEWKAPGLELGVKLVGLGRWRRQFLPAGNATKVSAAYTSEAGLCQDRRASHQGDEGIVRHSWSSQIVVIADYRPAKQTS